MPKWMRTLGIVLSVLAAVYFLSLIPRPSAKPKTPAVPKEIQRFTLVSPGLSIAVERVEGGWRLTSPLEVPANDGNVVNLLASLRSLSLEEVLSRRRESFGLFKVDETSGVILSVWGVGAKEPLVYIIGKNSPSEGHVYARIGNGQEVYLAKGMNRSLVEADLKTWRDSRALPLAPDAAIQSIRVRRKEGTLLVERSSDSWTIDGKAADQNAVDRLVSSLRYLSADEFVDPPFSRGSLASSINPSSTDLTVALSTGETHLLRFGQVEKSGTPRVLVRRDQDPHLFWVFANQVELLTVRAKDLLSK